MIGPANNVDTFIHNLRSMPSCGKQLQALKEVNLSSGPAHLQTKPQGIVPMPLVPISLSTGVDFVCYSTFNCHTMLCTNLGLAGCKHTGIG